MHDFLQMIFMKAYKKNKGGRPKVADAQTKEHIVCIRLDAVGYMRLEELKLHSGKSGSAVIRELIARGWVREKMRRAHLEMMAQLKGIARNLNQLTRLANAVGFGRAIVEKHQPIVGEITQILKRLRDDR